MMKPILTRISLIIGVAVALWTWGGAGSILWSKTSARIGILPFQIYSGTKVDYLQDVIPTRLAQKLRDKGQFTIIEGESVESLMPEKATGWLSRKELDRIALQTGANFLVFGSLTKIEENLSVDARVFTTLEESPSYKSFVEGEDLDHLIEDLGSRISQHILTLAPPAPPPAATPLESPIVEEFLEPVATPDVPELAEKERPTDAETSSATVASAPPVALPVIFEGEPPRSDLEPPSSIPGPVVTDTAPAQEVPPPRYVSVPAPPEVTEPPTRPGKKPSQAKTTQSYQPINITSDRMEADNRNRTVDFLGNVVAKREDMVIFADRITAFYTEDGKIIKIIARGNVKINQQDRIATCLQATFFQPSQKIVLTGSPKVWQGSNIVSGGKITISLNEDTIDIDGGGKNDRVNAVIYPMGKDLQ
jgi:lipopolysaccharide export system protein LptA